MVLYTRGGRPHLWVLAFSLLEVCLGVVICNSVLVSVGFWNAILNIGLLAVADGHEDTGKDNLENEDDDREDLMNECIDYLKHVCMCMCGCRR